MSSPELRRLVIRRARPWTGVFMVALVAGLLAVVAYAHMQTSERMAADRARAEIATANARVRTLNSRVTARNEQLGEQAAILKRTLQIERKAYGDVDRHLTRLQSEVLVLKEEVAFYRAIVSAEQTKGPTIQTFLIEREGDVFRFQLVLTRSMNSDKVTTGTVGLSVVGERNGQLAEFSFSDLAAPGANRLTFQFKYFQRLDGRLALPPKFVPKRVHVRVTTVGDRPFKVEKTFDWLAVLD